MKVVIIIVPARGAHRVHPVEYASRDNKAIEYGKPVCCCINGLLAKTLKKGEDLKVIYIMAGGESKCGQNRITFIKELEEICSEKGVKPEFNQIITSLDPTKDDLDNLLKNILEKIPENAEIFADTTYGYKPILLSLLCILRYAEGFRNAHIEYFIYGRAVWEGSRIIDSEIFDITPYYHLIKLLCSIEGASEETASKALERFFNYKEV